jgi:uncharacterized protein
MFASMARGASLSGWLLVLSACTSPREHYYLLERPAQDSVGLQGKSSTVLVGPVAIPAEIDRPQIVVRKGAHEIAFSEQQRWAMPLKEALPRMLAADMGRCRENTRFVPLLSGVSSTAKGRLAIDITRFEVSEEMGATVAMHWAYRFTESIQVASEGDATAHSIIENPGTEGLIEALRGAIAEIAETIARQLPNDS